MGGQNAGRQSCRSSNFASRRWPSVTRHSAWGSTRALTVNAPYDYKAYTVLRQRAHQPHPSNSQPGMQLRRRVTRTYIHDSAQPDSNAWALLGIGRDRKRAARRGRYSIY